ncbi:MAG TPA: DNA circularization N-terminal domain-containing protein [Chloroflexota bacterium]
MAQAAPFCIGGAVSGFTNVTGLPDPLTSVGFSGLLQKASFKGVPFSVVASQVRMGRRLAVHEYPFRPGGWPEDMGRALRTYSFTGFILGDLAPVLQLALNVVIESDGPGVLVHPSIGAVQVAVLSAATSIHKDKMRMIEVAFEFIEASEVIFPSAIIATAVSVVLLCTSALSASNSDLGFDAGPAALLGPQVTQQGQAAVLAFAATTVLAGADASGIVSMATALPPPDADTTYGRYAAGSATVLLPAGTTVATLQSQLATQRATLATAGTTASTAAVSYSASTDMMTPLAAVTEAVRTGITDPAEQVRVMLNLATFSFTPTQAGGIIGIGAAITALTTAMTAACRRAALISLARAEAAYQPISYDDAANLRSTITAALDSEITFAGDAEDDSTYLALKQLRSAIARDLTTRGASLPTVVTVSFGVSLPSLTIAQRLYKDASRADQITAESNTIHPAFCPTSFKALAGPYNAGNPATLVLPAIPPPVVNAFFSDGGVVYLLNAGVFGAGPVSAPGAFPPSSAGLTAGQIYWVGGTLAIVPGYTYDGTQPFLYLSSSPSQVLSQGAVSMPLTDPESHDQRLWNNGGLVCVSS